MLLAIKKYTPTVLLMNKSHTIQFVRLRFKVKVAATRRLRKIVVTSTKKRSVT